MLNKIKPYIIASIISITLASCGKLRTFSVVENKDYELFGVIDREKINDKDEYIVYIDVKLYEERGKAVLDEIAQKVCMENNKRWVTVYSHIVRFYLEGYKDEFYAVYKLDKNCNITGN